MSRSDPLGALKRQLRSPRAVVLEVVAIAVAGLVSTLVPQAPSLTERIRFASEWPVAGRIASALGLHHVFTTPGFLAVVLVILASLVVVLFDQARGIARDWRAGPGVRGFTAAPFHAEFTRPARGAGASERIERSGRLGIAGSALFHLGLIVLVLAGLARLLLGADAGVELYEGETLRPDPSAFEAQWPGLAASPVAFRSPVTLRELAPRRYASLRLERLRADLQIGDGAAGRRARVEVNDPLDLDGARLYVTQDYGVAALYEIVGGPAAGRHASLLRQYADGEFVKAEVLPEGWTVRARCEPGAGDRRPRAAEVRVLRRGGLLASGTLAPGDALALPDGGRLVLNDLRWWARFDGARDPSAVPAYVGLAVVVLGAILVFGVIPVDVLVRVEPDGELERVTVALRAGRLAPLFAERFAALVAREGGTEMDWRSS